MPPGPPVPPELPAPPVPPELPPVPPELPELPAPREPMLLPAREPVLRGERRLAAVRRLVFFAAPVFEPVLRLLFVALLRLVFFAAPRLLVPVLRLLFVAVVRPVDFAAVLRAVPPLFLAVDRRLVDALDFAVVERFAVDLVDFRPVALRPVLRLPPEVEPSSGHLPDITRCAASDTASAIRAPRRVALVITELAAWLAESAASIPASLIAFRAFGLALIAAAAAARPAASISLVIAALAILSTVESFDLDDLRLLDDFDVPDDPLRLLDFAIANLPFGRPIDT